MAEIATLMIGGGSSFSRLSERETPYATDKIAMKIRHLAVAMAGEETRDINLDVREGEILGIGGLAGQGKIGLVLANGALSSQTGGEGDIRKKIIEADLVEAIVAMPTNLFYSVTIPVSLWFISRNKKNKGKTVFIDARKLGTMVDRIHRDLSDEDISRIADTVAAFQQGTLADEKGFCAVASLQDIAAQDYILTPGRYVGIEEQEDDGEPFEEKMTRLTGELAGLFEQSHKLEVEIREKLGAIGYEI